MVLFCSKNVRRKVEGYLKLLPPNGINVFVSLSYRALDFGPGNPKTGKKPFCKTEWMEMKRRKKNQVNSRQMKKLTLNILLTFGNWGFHLPFPCPYKWKQNFKEVKIQWQRKITTWLSNGCLYRKNVSMKMTLQSVIELLHPSLKTKIKI